MTEGSRMAGRLCWLPHIAFDSDHGWLCSQTGRAPFPAQGLSLWRKTIFRGRTQTSSSCCHWNNCLPSSPLSPVTLSRPQLVTKQKQKPNEITYKCPMCAWGFRVRREGRGGEIEVGGEGWKERGFWKERTTFFLEHQVMEGKAGTLQPRAVQRTTSPIACHVDHLLSTVLDTCYHRWKGAGDSVSCEETTLLSESITERRQLTAAFWIGWHRQTVRKENKGRWSD